MTLGIGLPWPLSSHRKGTNPYPPSGVREVKGKSLKLRRKFEKKGSVGNKKEKANRKFHHIYVNLGSEHVRGAKFLHTA